MAKKKYEAEPAEFDARASALLKRKLVEMTATEPVELVFESSEKDRPPLNQDDVVHPWHYNVHPSGVECITIIQEFTFNIGAAVKHLWRAGLKGGTLKDLRKAAQYIEFEIARLEKAEAEGRGE